MGRCMGSSLWYVLLMRCSIHGRNTMDMDMDMEDTSWDQLLPMR